MTTPPILQNIIMEGTRAQQPDAGVVGRLYLVTDEGIVERDNGVAWTTYVAGGGLDPLTTAALVNEFFNFPSMEGADNAQPEWWEVSASATLTEVDISGEGITEKWARALKVVTVSSGKYAYQRHTYADEKRIKSGNKLSMLVAVWSVGGVAARVRLQSSVGSLGVSSDTTAASWSLLTVEGVTLDGTYVEPRFEVDNGTAYFVPLGLMIGEVAFPLRPRGLMERWTDAVEALNLDNAADPATWTDLDVTTYTSALAVWAQITFWLYSTNATTGYNLSVRRNGSSATGGRDVATQVIDDDGTDHEHTNTLWVVLDDQQIFEYFLDRWAGSTNVLLCKLWLISWKEWE